ncbi:NupC/NupG family nucleoside CNT transporter [Persicimonas caeni]|nr:nucleoside transporter C-terminal domain-containing protein [Persicimonas caeni]
MNQRIRHLSKRLFKALAWLTFLFCGFLIVTGTIIGMTGESAAQQDEGARPAQQVAGQVVENATTATQQTAEEQRARAAQADETERLAMELVARETSNVASGVGAQISERATSMTEATAAAKRKAALEGSSDTGFLNRAVSLFGIVALLGVAFLLSTNRRRIDWKLVGWGVGLQLAFALLILKMPGGEMVFQGATTAVAKLLEFTNHGSEFIFESFVTGNWEPALINFAFAVLPTIIFFSSLMTILYHLGVMQKIVYWMAKAMQKVMNTSGAETLSATANIFVGQTEAPLVVKPYVDKMTRSELMVVMTGGFATVAGGVMAIYVGMLQSTFPDIAGHLMAASVMSAPAALVVAKIMYPEVGQPETSGNLEMHDEKVDANLLDAASRGAAEGLKLALNVGAMLLAFLALIALIDYLLSLPSLLWNKGGLEDLVAYYQANGMSVPAGCALEGIKDDAVLGCIETMSATQGAPEVSTLPMIQLKTIFGYLFWPFAWIMGVPTEDCFLIAQLLGEKMVVNELVAYGSLSGMLADPNVQLSGRSVIIATYALCGFANFGSIGIQLGGIGGIAPGRKKDLAQIALRAMIGGTLAAFMTATVAGVLV